MARKPRFVWHLRIATGIIVLMWASVANAQVVLGSISGTIIDETGATLPGVTVTLTSPAIQVPQMVKISGPTGDYQFSELPAGVYRLNYELQGFGTLIREGIRLTTGFAARVDVSLKVATVAETVTVTGETPLVDVTNTRGGTTVSAEILQTTPNTGTMQDAFLIAGGVTAAPPPMNGENGLRTIGTVYTTLTYGQSITGITQQTIDGLLTFSNQFPDLSSVEEVNIRTFGNSAEVGAPGNSTVLIVKSGGNQFHGRYREAYQNHRLQANNIDDAMRAQGVTVGRQVRYLNDSSADLGGRIIRDKLWFYVAYHDSRNATYLPGFSLSQGADGKWSTADDVPAADTSSEPTPTVKVSYQLTPSHKFVGLYTKNTINEDGANGARFVPYQSSLSYSQPFPSAKGEYQGTLGSRVFVSQIFGWHYIAAYRNPQPCCATLVSTFDQVTQQQAGAAYTSLLGWRKATRHQTSGTINYLPGGSFFGTHQITAGYNLVPERFDVNLPVAASGDYRLVYNNGVPAQLWARNTPVLGTSSQDKYSAYVSDSWRPTKRLTMNAGVRWDRMTGFIPAQTKLQGPWPFARTGDLPAVDVGTWNALAPRLGGAFDLFGDGKTVVKGTFGRYNHDFEYGWIGQFNPNYVAETRYRWTDPTGCNCYVPGTINLDPNGSDVLSVTGSTNTFVNPNLKLIHTNESSIAIERELPHNLSMRALYLYKEVVGQTASVNFLRPYSVWNQQVTTRDPGPDNVANTADDGALVTFYDYDPAYRGSKFVANQLVNATDRKDFYNNIELQLQKRQTGKWFALTSFLATKNHRWLVSVVQSPNDNLFPLDETWTWSYRLSGGYDIPYGIRLSTTTQADNGIKGQRTVVFSAPSSGTLSIRVEPYGSQTEPVRIVSNLRGSKVFTLPGREKIALDIDCFNLFNTNVNWGATFVSGPTFGYLTNFAQSRILRLGASFEF